MKIGAAGALVSKAFGTGSCATRTRTRFGLQLNANLILQREFGKGANPGSGNSGF
jgi:hypothetical protein